MRKVFHMWTSKRFWYLPLPYRAHIRIKECIIVREKVFGTKVKRRELVLGTELPGG